MTWRIRVTGLPTGADDRVTRCCRPSEAGRLLEPTASSLAAAASSLLLLLLLLLLHSRNVSLMTEARGIRLDPQTPVTSS